MIYKDLRQVQRREPINFGFLFLPKLIIRKVSYPMSKEFNENKVIEMYQNGDNPKDIIKENRISSNTLYKVLQRNNIPVRRKIENTTEYIDSMIPKMCELYEAGYKIKHIEKELGIGERVISRRLHQVGYIIRQEHRSIEHLMKYSEEIIKMYDSGIGTPAIAKKFDCVSAQIWRVLRKNKQKTKPCKLYYVNSNFFEKIDNEANSYCLGMWASDGYISTKGTKSAIGLVDKEHIQKIKDIMNYTGPIRLSMSPGNKQDFWKIDILDKKLREDLIKLGIVAKKSLILQYPKREQVPENLIRHFIRGEFDGDGSIYHYKCDNWKISKRWCFSIVGTLEMMEGIKSEFLRIGIKDKNMYITKNHKNNKNTWRLTLNNYHALACLEWLYEDSTIWLDRKYERFLELRNDYASRGLTVTSGDYDLDYFYDVPKGIYVRR